MSDSETLDLIVYGASGYTGKLVAEYLNRRYGVGGEIRWGIAGRNRDKLLATCEELGCQDVPVLIADSGDQASIDAMVGACKVVLTTTGPYQQYGAGLVESCARQGTDYVDLCGEPLWMAEMLSAHQDAARASGARIIFSCGFDSIPSDLGVQYLQEQAQQQRGKALPRVKCRVKALKGHASGGTVASFTATMEAAKSQPDLFATLANPFALTEGFTGADQPAANEKIFEEDLDSWSVPFVMATINTKVVHRSNFLLDHAYGADLVYDEMVLLDDSAAAGEGNDFGFDMSLKPGEGPTREQREAGFYEMWFVGSDSDGSSLTAIVTGDQDPGYGSTSKIVAEAAICLAQKPKAQDGGFHTSASAMGAALRQRLQDNAGLTFSVADS